MAGSRVSDTILCYVSDVFHSYVLLVTSAAEGPFPISTEIKYVEKKLNQKLCC